jgi:hypothetical protein
MQKTSVALEPTACNCLALRQAARHTSQIYDTHLALVGLRTTQYSILAKLKRLGPLSINELANSMVMDRTTLGPRGRLDQTSRLVRSLLVHVHHAAVTFHHVTLACGSAGRCSTHSGDGKLDFDRSRLLELQRRLEHLALLQGVFEVHEH